MTAMTATMTAWAGRAGVDTPPANLERLDHRFYFPGAPAIDYYRRAYARERGLASPPDRASTAFAYLLSSLVLRPAWQLGTLNPYPVLLRRLAPERVTVRSLDGLRLAGLYFPSARARAGERRPGVVVVHGRAVNKESTLHYVSFLRRRYDVLAIDLRGHGESEGTVTTFGAHEVRDVSGAVSALLARGATSVAALGGSLGAASSLLAAGCDPRIRCVVADAPFARLRELLDLHRARLHIPREPFSPLAKSILDRRCDFDIDRVNPEEAVGRTRAPVLVIHGTGDRTIPVGHGRRVQERAAAGSVLWTPSGGHGTVYFRHRRGFIRRVLRFLRSHLDG